MLENEAEREEVDESSRAERSLVSFLRPPLPPPDCGLLPRLLDQSYPLGGALSYTAVPPPSVASARAAANCPDCWTKVAPSAVPSATPASDAPPPPPPSLSPLQRWWWSPPPPFLLPPHGCGLRGRDCRGVAVSLGCVPPTLPPGFG